MSKENKKDIFKKNPILLTKKSLYKIYDELLKKGKISETGAAKYRMEQIGVSMNMIKKWADIKEKFFNSDLVGSSIVKN